MRSALVPLAIAASCLAVPLASTAAHAEPYIGLGLGSARQQLVCAQGAPCDRDAAGLKLFGGWRFNEQFGAELAWTRAVPQFTASDSVPGLTWYGAFKVQVFSASATYDFSLGGIDLQLRAGIAQVKGEFESASVGVPDSDANETRPMLGLGARRQLDDHWAVRADFDITQGQAYTREGRFSTFTVGIEYRF